jgi:hypothetical protein
VSRGVLDTGIVIATDVSPVPGEFFTVTTV